ncbi:MAG: protein TolR [Gammaproteobacteria bacterium TMED78]|nr:MAG: protein TolR [Gammaproteobacteria bacterium TMED78]|tara:strand:+ start:1428 stop:1868 length:441 start_codon:yes stop_codon:yes gene_type:complete
MKKITNRRLVAEINVVPYIDVMLVLLIIFMVTAPLLTQGIKVDLPDAASEPLEPSFLENNEPLVLSIDNQGSFYLNVGDKEDEPIDNQTVTLRTAAIITRNPNTPILVNADRSISYDKLVEGMVLLQQGGADQIGFITDPVSINPF